MHNHAYVFLGGHTRDFFIVRLAVAPEVFGADHRCRDIVGDYEVRRVVLEGDPCKLDYQLPEPREYPFNDIRSFHEMRAEIHDVDPLYPHLLVRGSPDARVRKPVVTELANGGFELTRIGFYRDIVQVCEKWFVIVQAFDEMLFDRSRIVGRFVL